jgi:hypothetical protein
VLGSATMLDNASQQMQASTLGNLLWFLFLATKRRPRRSYTMLQTRFTVARRENVFVFIEKPKLGFHYGRERGDGLIIPGPWDRLFFSESFSFCLPLPHASIRSGAGVSKNFVR